MEVTVPLFRDQINCGAGEISDIYREYYRGGLVRYSGASEEGFCSAGAFEGRDDMEVSVFGNDDRLLLVSRFDNLGKGASGAALQNMNLVLGLEQSFGLCVQEE
jgi:N-acetyl-gamma-glutamyl-phosphate reductase